MDEIEILFDSLTAEETEALIKDIIIPQNDELSSQLKKRLGIKKKDKINN